MAIDLLNTLLNSGGGGGGASSFRDLTDVDPSWVGEGGKLVAVNSAATALEYVDPPASTFAELTDGPGFLDSTVTGKTLAVNRDGNALEYVESGGGQSAANYIKATMATTQVIGNSTTTIIQLDAVSAVSSSAWTLNGSYEIVVPANVTQVFACGQITFEQNVTGDRLIYVYKNGAIQFSSRIGSSKAFTTSYMASGMFSVSEGDLITLRAHQDSGDTTYNISDASLSIFTLSSSTVLIGGNSGSLIEEKILAADESTVEFLGLNSLVDGDYTLEFIMLGGNTTTSNLTAYINNDSTAGRYGGRYQSGSTGSATTASGTLITTGITVGALASTSAASGSAGVVKIKRISGLTMYQVVHGYRSNANIGDESWTGFYSQDVDITSLVLNSGSSLIKAGSTFRLYGSKTPTQLVSYNPIDYGNFSSDRLLRAGEVAYIDYASVTSVPLNIQSEEGLYEIDILGDISGSTYTAGDVTLQPNAGTANVPAANSVLGSGSYVSLTTSDADGIAKSLTGVMRKLAQFYIGGYQVVNSFLQINTNTVSKSVNANFSFKYTSTGFQQWDLMSFWTDTTTAWTSLGTITFPFAQSGKIVIRRII